MRAEVKRDFFTRFPELPCRIPGGRIFARIKPAELMACLYQWLVGGTMLGDGNEEPGSKLRGIFVG
jgi:hypothetical protein